MHLLVFNSIAMSYLDPDLFNWTLTTVFLYFFQLQGMHADVSKLEKASIWREASRIVREEGVRAFWKGNLVTITHRLPYSSISFYAFERYKNVGTIVL